MELRMSSVALAKEEARTSGTSEGVAISPQSLRFSLFKFYCN